MADSRPFAVSTGATSGIGHELARQFATHGFDALALNAGIGNGGAFTDIPLADEQRLLAVNVSATVHLAKRLVPDMVQRGAGRVLFTSSVASQLPGPYYATYAASKAFIQSFAHALRYELAGRDGFQALMAGKSQVVAGSLKNKIQTAGARLMPEQARAAIHARMTKPNTRG